MGRASIGNKIRSGNPFSDKARYWRAQADKLNTPTVRDRAMADAFPLGVGYGCRGGSKRIEASITRAGKAVHAVRQAEHYESCEKAFAEGRINAQGRNVNAASLARSEKRQDQQERRQAKIDAAKAEVEARGRANVSPETWATSRGRLAGSARQLVMSDQVEYLRVLEAV